MNVKPYRLTVAASLLLTVFMSSCDPSGDALYLFTNPSAKPTGTSLGTYRFTLSDVVAPRGQQVFDSASITFAKVPGPSVILILSPPGIEISPPEIVITRDSDLGKTHMDTTVGLAIRADSSVPTGSVQTVDLLFNRQGVFLVGQNILTVHVVQGTIPDFSLSLPVESLTLTPGGSVSETITLQRLSMAGPVSFALVPAPGAPFSASFNPNPAVGTSTELTITLDGGATPPKFYAGGVTATSGNLSRVIPIEVSLPQQVHIAQSGTTENLHGVYSFSSGTNIAVGDHGTIVRYDGAGNILSSLLTGTSRLNAVSFNPLGVGVAVGDTGTLLWSSDFGASWAIQSGPASQNLYGVLKNPVNSLGAIAVGAGGTVLQTTDAGATWNTGVSGTGADLFSVTSSGSGNSSTAAGDSGTLIRSSDFGKTWTPLNSGVSAVALRSLFAVNALVMTAVGDGGIILQTTTGTTWLRSNSGTLNDLFGVAFTDQRIGYAVGARGVVLRTVNGGTTWRPQLGRGGISLNGASAVNGAGYYATAVGDTGTIVMMGP